MTDWSRIWDKIESIKKSEYTSETVSLGGMDIKRGDVIEVVIGRRTLHLTFFSWDRNLYALIGYDDKGNSILIPYKSIKYMTKLGGDEKSNSTDISTHSSEKSIKKHKQVKKNSNGKT